MKRDATISSCGSYRYDLTRITQPDCNCKRCADMRASRLTANNTRKFGYVLWALCNPSIADADIDDPTERRCWGFTSSWGYSKMVLVNVNPYRSTNPKCVKIPGELILAHNDGFLMAHAVNASLIICAWGSHDHKGLAYRAQRTLVTAAPEKIHTLGLTRGGMPLHPLYLSKNTMPQPWTI